MSYHRGGWDDSLDYSDDSAREDQAGDDPPACGGCRKSDHCPAFLPAVQSYLADIREWRDRDGDPVRCRAGEDEGAIGVKLRVLGYRWGVEVANRPAIAAEMANLRRHRGTLRIAGRRTVRGKARDARGRWVLA